MIVNAGKYAFENEILTAFPEISRAPGFSGGKAIYKAHRSNENLQLELKGEYSKI